MQRWCDHLVSVCRVCACAHDEVGRHSREDSRVTASGRTHATTGAHCAVGTRTIRKYTRTEAAVPKRPGRIKSVSP
eukprot:7384775-Prymnesium_polylepis.2